MEMSQDQRNKAIDKASTSQLSLYSDPDSGAKLKKIANKHQEMIKEYGVFAIAVGDVILGLVPQEKLPDLLVERLGIPKPDALRVTADVLDFLAPLANPDTETQTPTAAANETTIPIKSDLASEIAETEAALTAVKPMHTMQSDMAETQKETGTTSPAATPPARSVLAAAHDTVPEPKELIHQATSQDSLLADGPGNQTKNPGGRWDTAQPK